MPLALILSSHVAASRVGGFAQSLALEALGVDPVLAPTVLFGRHPGWGSPGGGVVEDAQFVGMVEGIEAQGLYGLFDLVLTGYFASPGQVEAAAAAVEAIRSAPRGRAFSPRVRVVVDPILGDAHTGAYVRPDVERALIDRLAPLADVLTPNLWELGRLTGQDCHSPDGCLAAARPLGSAVLVTSAPAPEGETGLYLIEADRASGFFHPRLDQVPHGTGDLTAAVFGASLILGKSLEAAAEQAARAAYEAVEAARDWGAPELPIVALAQRLAHPTAPVRREPLP